MSRRGWVAAAAGVSAVVVAAAGAVALHGRDVPAVPMEVETQQVVRTTLRTSETVGGVVSYGRVTVIRGHGGTVTALPVPGSVIRRGQAVYRVDDRPVPLFYGRLPLYRTLSPGDRGADVREVEANLAALGLTGFTVDDRFTGATAHAVHKLAGSWDFDPHAVVVAAGALRVSAVSAQPGDDAAGPLLSLTGTVRVIEVALDASLQGIARAGDPAVITLPDGRQVRGRVAAVGTAATQGERPGDPATVAVTVTVPGQAALGRLDRADVDVALTAQQAADVLAVPVLALVALAEGGYGVQLADGGYRPVRVGLIADGMAEVSGAGLAEGTRVVVPS